MKNEENKKPASRQSQPTSRQSDTKQPHAKQSASKARAAKKESEKKVTEAVNNVGENDTDALAPLVGTLFREIAEAGDRQIVIVCFGTTAISGDSLGPYVGSLLREKYNVPAFVYGTEEHSVNGKNMSEWLDFIKSVHEGALFVAVDASLGQSDKVGQIVVRTDGVCPAAIKGKKARFGDVGILGVVAQSGKDPLMQLMTVSTLYVQDMADKVSNLLSQALFA